MTISGVRDIYRTLNEIGIKKSHVRALMPDWWDDGIASTESGVWEFALLLGRRLSIDASALIAGSIVAVGSASNIAFKHKQSISNDQYKAGSMIGAALAEAVTAAMPHDFILRESDPYVIRESIRTKNNGIVDFDGLLDFCWAHGIAIIPLPNFPIGVRKMDGAIFKINNRPAIIISRKNDSKSWLSFILAHELGHHCLKHLEQASSIIDVDLKREATYQSEYSADIQEREADRFALSLLGGESTEATISRWSPRFSGVEIAVAATEASRSAGAAAGHLVLRYAFITNRWLEAQAALRFIPEDNHAQSALVDTLARNVKLEEIAEDLRGLVINITGIPDLD